MGDLKIVMHLVKKGADTSGAMAAVRRSIRRDVRGNPGLLYVEAFLKSNETQKKVTPSNNPCSYLCCF